MTRQSALAEADACDRIRRLMYEISGVNITDGKQELVRARIAKRMRVLGHEAVETYVDFVEGEEGARELAEMVDVLTTNKTSFFRELPHFEFLRKEVVPAWLRSGGPLRLWSAGCSSGEEPYSVAMLLAEEVPDLGRRDVKILATDLSRTVLERARGGRYDAAIVEELPARIRERYFRPVGRRGAGGAGYDVVPETRERVSFAPLNLMEVWPMRGPFNVILCRNVMIYFDRPTREKLIRRFRQLLAPTGHLLVGHSESLSGMEHELTYVQPAVYRR
ncbi:MAG TPA: protein-glutamate O-methyltransferase [Longimicrobiales bacterium]|nr:protein-glutamate O-methyltransferase [Longimicrobiales bacterium]